MEIRKLIKNEQGIAFPMAMIVMAILSALMAAFAVLATSEPQIAANHMGSTQARASSVIPGWMIIEDGIHGAQA